MDFYITEKALSFSDKIDITDQQQNTIYYIKGDVISLGRKLHMYDQSDNEICYIHRELFHLMPKYIIEFNDDTKYSVDGLFSIFRLCARVKELNWLIESEKLAHEFSIYEDDNLVAQVSRQWFTWNSYYHIHIEDGYDNLLVLSVFIAIIGMLNDSAAAASSGNNAANN